MRNFFKTVIFLYRIVNNSFSRFIVKNIFLIFEFFIRWFFIIVIGPLNVFLFKRSFKRAFTKMLPRMIKKYFKVTFPKILKGKLKKTFPINMILKFIE